MTESDFGLFKSLCEQATPKLGCEQSGPRPYAESINYPAALAIACNRIAELEARIRKASDMLEDDGRFGDRAHDARRAAWNTLVGEVNDG